MLNVGIIGCGRIAGGFDINNSKNYPSTHAAAYKEHPKTELIAVSDLDENKMKEFENFFGHLKKYSNYLDLVDDNELDIVSVCTPEDTHYDIVKKIAGKTKLIFCEKPLATTSSEAKEMIDICSKNGTLLVVNHSRRWDELYNSISSVDDIIAAIEKVEKNIKKLEALS